MPHHSQHPRTIFLLNSRLLIFPIRTAPRLNQSVTYAVFKQGLVGNILVGEIAAIVDIQRPQSKRQANTQSLGSLCEQHLCPYRQRRAFSPAAGDVGQDQTMDTAATIHINKRGDAVHFHAA